MRLLLLDLEYIIETPTKPSEKYYNRQPWLKSSKREPKIYLALQPSLFLRNTIIILTNRGHYHIFRNHGFNASFVM